MVPWKGTSVNPGLVGSRAPGGASKSSSSLTPGLTWVLITGAPEDKVWRLPPLQGCVV